MLNEKAVAFPNEMHGSGCGCGCGCESEKERRKEKEGGNRAKYCPVAVCGKCGNYILKVQLLQVFHIRY